MKSNLYKYFVSKNFFGTKKVYPLYDTKKVRSVFENSSFCRIGVIKLIPMTSYIYNPFNYYLVEN